VLGFVVADEHRLRRGLGDYPADLFALDFVKGDANKRAGVLAVGVEQESRQPVLEAVAVLLAAKSLVVILKAEHKLSSAQNAISRSEFKKSARESTQKTQSSAFAPSAIKLLLASSANV